MIYDLFIPMKNVGKQRPRLRKKVTGRSKKRAFTPQETKDAETIIGFTVKNHMQMNNVFTSIRPIAIYLNFTFIKNHLSSPGQKLPMGRGIPDTDNLAKTVLDGLNGIAYKDDSQVMLLKAEKSYFEQEGVMMSILEMEDQ